MSFFQHANAAPLLVIVMMISVWARCSKRLVLRMHVFRIGSLEEVWECMAGFAKEFPHQGFCGGETSSLSCKRVCVI